MKALARRVLLVGSTVALFLCTATAASAASQAYECLGNYGAGWGCMISASQNNGDSFVVGNVPVGQDISSFTTGCGGGECSKQGDAMYGALTGLCVWAEPQDYWTSQGQGTGPSSCNPTIINDTHSWQSYAWNTWGNNGAQYIPYVPNCSQTAGPCWSGPCNEYLNELPWAASGNLTGKTPDSPVSSNHTLGVRYGLLNIGGTFMMYDSTNQTWVFVQDGNPSNSCWILP